MFLLSYVEKLTALENIVLDEKGSIRRGSSWMNKKKLEIEQITEKYGLRFPTDVPIWQLS
jgi:simple sugar transport system ATP-binding protein